MWQFIGRKHSAGNKHHLLEEVDNGNAHPPVEASTAPTALTVAASQWRKSSTVEKSQHRRLDSSGEENKAQCLHLLVDKVEIRRSKLTDRPLGRL